MQELAEIEQGQELTTLTSGLPEFIKLIKSKVDYKNIDIDSKKGRDEIVSNAFKVTKTKTAISKQIDALINSKKEEIEPTLKIIDSLKSSKKTTNSELSDLSKSVRQVVTDWEERDQVRIAEEKARLETEAIKKEKDYDESLAAVEDELFNMRLEKRLNEERILEAERVEKLKIEQEARDQKIADDAATKAREDAEAEKAQAIQDKKDAEEVAKQAEIDKLAAVEVARLAEIKAVADANDAKIKAENDAKTAKIQADKDKKDAAETARIAEKKRQDDEKAAIEAVRLKVESNKKHVLAILKEIRERFMKDCGIDEITAKKIVNSIRKGGRISINYGDIC